MAGDEVVHIGQRGPHPNGKRLQLDVGWPWVHPDQAPGLQLKPACLASEQLGVAAIPAVTEDDHDRAPREPPAPPGAVELPERRADPGSPRPVGDRGTGLLERSADVAVVERHGRARQPCREGECLGPDPSGDRGLERGEQHAREPLHRARDVGDQKKAARPQRSRTPGGPDRLAFAAKSQPYRAAEVEATAPSRWLDPPRDPLRMSASQLLPQRIDRGELVAFVFEVTSLGPGLLRAVCGEDAAPPSVAGLLRARRRDLLSRARRAAVEQMPRAALKPKLRQRFSAVLWSRHAVIGLAMLGDRPPGGVQPLAAPEALEDALEGGGFVRPAEEA